jgi:hypothetical protein
MAPRSASRGTLQELIKLLTDAVTGIDDIDLVVYGSTAQQGFLGRDLDLWLDGDLRAIESASQRLEIWQQREGLALDIVTPVELANSLLLDTAVRWSVRSHGHVVVGAMPRLFTAMSYDRAQLAFRYARAREAADLAERAEILARGGLHSTDVFAQASARAWLRSASTDWRRARDIQQARGDRLIVRITDLDPTLARLVRACGWGGPTVTARLLEQTDRDALSMLSALRKRCQPCTDWPAPPEVATEE